MHIEKSLYPQLILIIIRSHIKHEISPTARCKPTHQQLWRVVFVLIWANLQQRGRIEQIVIGIRVFEIHESPHGFILSKQFTARYRKIYSEIPSLKKHSSSLS